MRSSLPESAGIKIAVHVDAAERPLDRIDSAILIAIQLLKMVMRQIGSLRIRDAGRVRMRTRIVALGVFENAIVHEIRPRLYQGFWHDLFRSSHRSMTFSCTDGRLDGCRLCIVACGDRLRLRSLLLHHIG